jgi:transcriptional regulator of acetoin/glycerol metabolism
VRPIILESWKRSHAYGVDPTADNHETLPAEETRACIERNQGLINISRPYMERLYSVVAGTGFYLMISDQNGIVLDLIGDADIVRIGREHSNLVIGADRSEKRAGTNAIAVCLHSAAAIQVWADEHYVENRKEYGCSAGPIKDELGMVIGSLNITGRADRIHPHTLGMVLAACDGISKELSIRKAYKDIHDLVTKLEAFRGAQTDEQTMSIDAVEESAIRRSLYETDGNISKAAELLGVGRSTLYRKLERYGIER